MFRIQVSSESKCRSVTNMECFLCDKLSQYSLWQKIEDLNIEYYRQIHSNFCGCGDSRYCGVTVAAALRLECAIKITLPRLHAVKTVSKKCIILQKGIARQFVSLFPLAEK